MNDLSRLTPRQVWRIFARICAIPHPSGAEGQLREYLRRRAEAAGWNTRTDSAGNLRIDRPGFDPEQAIILQAHLDMVPALAPGKVFDFFTDPVECQVSGKNVVADGTTLGADDGMGVALALAALEEPMLRNCALSALFTVSEEIGMIGARQLDADFLAGKLLVNLDSGDDRICQIGCAGGVRTALRWEVPEAAPTFACGLEFELDHLYGGHSGVDIDKHRANAIILLAKLLTDLPLEIADFTGGNADNAIPASARIVAAAAEPEKLAAEFSRRLEALRPTLSAEDREVSGRVQPCPLPHRVWAASFTKKFLPLLGTAPNGVISRSKRYQVVQSSSNIGQILAHPGKVELISSQRSLIDAECDLLSASLVSHFAPTQVEAEKSHAYPAWPVREIPEQAVAKRLWRELYHEEMEFEIVHAGLECGIFAGLRPDLPMIAFFPHHGNLHSCTEFVEIASVERIYAFLLRFLAEIN